MFLEVWDLLEKQNLTWALWYNLYNKVLAEVQLHYKESCDS